MTAVAALAHSAPQAERVEREDRYGDGSWSERALRAHPELSVESRRHFFGCATSFTGMRAA